jgi:hypothetical protein
VPQRQYENIKGFHEFTNEEERQKAIQLVIEDCITLKDIVTKLTDPEKGTTAVISGVGWKKINGKWVYDEKPA